MWYFYDSKFAVAWHLHKKHHSFFLSVFFFSNKQHKW